MKLVKDPHSDNPYLRAGFRGRREYLKYLSDSYGMPYKRVYNAAVLLGEIEDFDGLITFLDEYSEILG